MIYLKGLYSDCLDATPVVAKEVVTDDIWRKNETNNRYTYYLWCWDYERYAGIQKHPCPIKNLIDYLETGESLDDFLEDFPSVSREQAVHILVLAREVLLTQVYANSHWWMFVEKTEGGIHQSYNFHTRQIVYIDSQWFGNHYRS